MASQNILSEDVLQDLANQLFKAVPGGAAKESVDFSVADPQTDLPDPFFDNGRTLTTASPISTERSSDNELTSFIQHTEQSYKRDYHNFDLNNPQTSLPDASFYDGQIPKSVSGFGGSPGVKTSLGNNASPFDLNYDPKPETATSFLPGKDAFRYESQLPQIDSDPSFYFSQGFSFIENIRVGYPGSESILTPAKDFGNFDVEAVRKDFPILSEQINGRQLVWFDNAATTQKPLTVIERLCYFYKHENSNIHRAAHELAARSTDAYEDARKTIQQFINAGSVNEIIFTRGTTESINLVAATWGDQHLGKDDEIIISNLEHHANIVPWQLLAKKKGFKINIIPVNDHGELLLDEYAKLLSPKTKLVTFTHVSNALGTVTPAKKIIELAHAVGAKVLLDGAQSVSHFKVDLQYLNPDFFVLSGHKLFGPTGIGVLYGKEEILNTLQPYQGGGNMIQDVTFERTLFHPAPNRFEAGTGNIADAVGLGAAIKYVQKIGIERIGHYEHELLDYATNLFKQIPGVTLIGTAKEKASVMSFTLKGYTNDEVGKVLNDHGIAVRTGHHCAQPILRRLGYESSVRPSFAFYNTKTEVDRLAQIIDRLSGQRR